MRDEEERDKSEFIKREIGEKKRGGETLVVEHPSNKA